MPIELGPKGVDPARAVGTALSRAPVDERSAQPARKAVAAADPVVERRLAIEPGQPPVDADRVSRIRHAIESGTYPLFPARAADAMIAAGILLRTGQRSGLGSGQGTGA